MFDAKVPNLWRKISWQSSTLGFWYTELLERNDQFYSWVFKGRPDVFWMTGLFNPQGLMFIYTLQWSFFFFFACTFFVHESYPIKNVKMYTVKPVLSGHSKKRPKIGFQDGLSLNAGQKYCRMLHGEHSAILLTFITLPLVIKLFVLSIFEWPLKTGFTVPLCWFMRKG